MDINKHLCSKCQGEKLLVDEYYRLKKEYKQTLTCFHMFNKKSNKIIKRSKSG